jgi:hypothetical protein
MIRSFSEFWPFYLAEHSKSGTRALHFIGTTLLLLSLVLAVYQTSALYILYGVLCGYGFAWIGHFLIEKNRPATFQYPFYSLIADFKMYGLMLTGRLGDLPQSTQRKTNS